MSVWVEGRRYDYYGEPIVCVRRYFEGTLELVDLRFAGVAATVDGAVVAEVFTRTALALAPCVRPMVTATLGGVTSSALCNHRGYGRLVADAGPNEGRLCCHACGGAVEESV